MSFQTDKEIQQKFFSYTLFVLVVLLICRLIANYFFPLFDTTESRYAEIARKMLETGNWVTLQQDYGVPFWAKPPLSIWLSAFFMQLLGVNEFAVRLPGLCSLLVFYGWFGEWQKNRVAQWLRSFPY